MVSVNFQLVRSVDCMELSVIDGLITEAVVMLTGHKGGGKTVLCEIFTAIDIPGASEVRATHFEVRVAPVDSSAHVQQADTGLGTAVMCLVTQVLTSLVIVVTLEGRAGVVTWRGHGQRPTLIADCIISIARPPFCLDAALSGGQAAVLVSGQGAEGVIVRSTVTVVTVDDALVSTRHEASCVVTVV